MTPSQHSATLRRLRWFLIVSLVSLVVASASVGTSLTADPIVYRSRMEELFQGSIPYSDMRFEHLPLSLVPMTAAWLLGGFTSDGVFRAVFATLMGACLLGSLRATSRLGDAVGIETAGLRWLFIAAPLFPLVLFRSDPWPMFLASSALTAMVLRQDSRGLTYSVLAVLAKGWPVVLAVVEWWKQRRGRAVALVIATAATGFVLLLTPGFRAGRDFSGVHSETLVGGLLGLTRAVTGRAIGLQGVAGGTYISANEWLIGVQVLLGGMVLVIAGRRLNRLLSRRQAILLPGVLVCGVLLGSPLLSAQFILWPTPFFAFREERRIVVASFVLGLLTLGIVLVWRSAVSAPLLFFGIVTARNVGLIALTFMALDLLVRQPAYPNQRA